MGFFAIYISLLRPVDKLDYLDLTHRNQNSQKFKCWEPLIFDQPFDLHNSRVAALAAARPFLDSALQVSPLLHVQDYVAIGVALKR